MNLISIGPWFETLCGQMNTAILSAFLVPKKMSIPISGGPVVLLKAGCPTSGTDVLPSGKRVPAGEVQHPIVNLLDAASSGASNATVGGLRLNYSGGWQ